MSVYARDIVIIVEDEELGLPLEGATVSLRDGRQFSCNRDGVAQVNLPDNRQTIVQITYPGYDTRRMNIPAFVEGKGVERYTVSLRLGGVMEARELVIEAQKPQTSETKSGRSVAISERELERTAEIGIIEDVMNSVKLLPGVGYTGMFGALPSIRGGDPGDLMSVFDGFYLERPYHWVGAVSVFDPKMVASARLSHGVFSSRYGHTISGLLEVTSKSPSSTEVELETAISTSAASLNLSYPLNGKGGILFMGKVTYWDTFIWLLKGLSQITDNESLARINAISTSPYIRSAAIAANYRFTPDLEWRLNAFFGSDGVGADYITEYNNEGINGRMEMKADYDNYQGFMISGITASPTPKLALRFSGGAGFMETITNDMVDNNVTVRYNDDFWPRLDSYYSPPNPPPPLLPPPFPQLPLLPSSIFKRGTEYTAPNVNAAAEMESTVFTAQVRADADIDLGKGFITGWGVQELYSLWRQTGDISLNFVEINIKRLLESYRKGDYQGDLGEIGAMIPYLQYFEPIPNATIIMARGYLLDVRNQGFTTSAYGLVEYKSPNQKIGAELGLRLDHLYFLGKDFAIQTMPALNPRLNVDINIFKNKGLFDSLDITLGTGLFSSIDKLLSFISPNFGDGDLEIKFNRAWTSVIGIKTDITQGYSFNIEGYYKRVFDRAYITADTVSSNTIKPDFNFDGVGNVWGFDLQLQKMESRYWDGWISYSFNWTKYNNPKNGNRRLGSSSAAEDMSDFWFWPSFHRFHNCNVVMNIKPLQWFHIGIRFGFASGTPRNKVDNEIYPYPALLIKENVAPVIIQKYGRKSWYDENERSAWSLPLDIKFSFFLANKKGGRANTEIYIAAENLSTLFYKPVGNTTFNQYTGKEDEGGSGASGFNLPFPLISFGFKWRY